MQSRDVIGEFLSAYPRESMKGGFFVAVCVWQSVPAVIGLCLYLLLQRYMRVRFPVMVGIGLMLFLLCVYLETSTHQVGAYLQQGFALNQTFWRLMAHEGLLAGFQLVVREGFNYVMGASWLMAVMFMGIDRMPINRHKQTLSALQQGKALNLNPELNAKAIQQALQLCPDHGDGTMLGVSKHTGFPVTLSDHAINQVVLVLGTTGAGKTISLRRFYLRAMTQGYPLIIVDGKPTDENVAWVQALAARNGRRFYGFNWGNHDHYNAFMHGGYTELKDKMISLKDQWENDYYRSIAEDYLQTTFAVLLKSGQPFDLETVVRCLNFEELVVIARNTKDKVLLDRVRGIEGYDQKDITGLQAHLNLLVHSELGEYFKIGESSFNLLDAITQNAVIYFALPALRFPSFSQVLGKFVINDLKAVIDRQSGDKRIFSIFDEFSVFAGEQVVNLVNMGRGKGMHAIFGTQGLAELDKVDVTFKELLLNCANTILCHRLNDQTSAETIANWVGTEDAFTLTAQLNVNGVAADGGGLGSVRQNKSFIVHPDSIKQGLGTGEGYLISKVGGFRQEKVVVKYTR